MYYTLSYICLIINTSLSIFNSFLNIKDDDLYNNIANNIDFYHNLNMNQIITDKFCINKTIINSEYAINISSIDINDTKRLLLTTELIPQQNSGYKQVNTLIRYIISPVLPTIIFHMIVFNIANRANFTYIKDKLVGLLGFPAFELVISFALLSQLIQAASILYENYLYTHSHNAYVATFVTLTILPFTIIIACFWFVFKYIWPWNYKNNELHYNKNIFPDVRTALIKNSLGKWHPEKFENYCGIFYEHIRGPCHDNSYVNLFRLFHVPLKLIKNGASIFIINCYKEGAYGNVMQVGLLISLVLLNIVNMIVCRPLNGIRQQWCEILAEIANLFEYVYIYRMVRLRYDSKDAIISNENYKLGIYASQKASFAVFIFTQVWSGILTLRLLLMFVYNKIHASKESNDASSNLRTEVAEGDLDNVDTSGLSLD